MSNSNKNPYKKNWYRKATNSSACKEVYNFKIAPKYGYEAFSLYFLEELENYEEIINNVRAFEAFIRKNSTLFPLTKIKEDAYFTIDIKLLLNDKTFSLEWENLQTNIVENTDVCLKCMGLAMHQTIYTQQETSLLQDDLSCKIINARLFNIEPVIQLRHLKVNLYGKLISIKGTIIKASVPKLYCQYLVFTCCCCRGTQVIKQTDGNYVLPKKCLSKGCRSHNFKPELNSPLSRTIIYQVIKLQEIVEDTQGLSGRIPSTIECDLSEDLVGSCIPGDDVILTGVVKVRSTSEEKNKNKQSSIFLLYIDAVSVINERANSQNTSISKLTFNTSDISLIQKIHSEPELFRLLVHSLCPSIYGHEMVKAGLLLALFGGTRNELEKRSDCHVLVVGDPGLGKSQMLQACANVSPRGIYVCGNTSTGSGLTVTMVRDGEGEFSLEAGALILADQGCCCIDEFDKMNSQHANLLEVMEQQCISIAKAGVSRSLPTKASILAAANPVGGHYNKGKTVAENLKIGSPLLSRFDIIFILLDQPNEHLDMLLSEHVLALHSRRKINKSSSQTSTSRTECDSSTLRSKLSLHPAEKIDSLPHSLFRTYIAYARKYVHPKLNEEANSTLKNFYLDLRESYHNKDCTPITARQLESMRRLTQARAKLELRAEATIEDALEVVEIMRSSLVDVFTDELGTLDFSRSPDGSGMSNKQQATTFLNLIQRKSHELQKSIFDLKELQQYAQQAHVLKNKFYSIIDSLNINGLLLKKGSNRYQLVSTDY